jgi:hypothetical protein
MKLTALQREYLTILAGQPEGWFTASETAFTNLGRPSPHGDIHYHQRLRGEARRARGVLHRLADKGLVNRSPVGRPPGVGELRFKVRGAGLDALETS